MSDETVLFQCGSGNEKCRCNCDASRDPKTFEHVCEHSWDGWREWEEPGGGASAEAVCSRCGMGALHHALWMGL